MKENEMLFGIHAIREAIAAGQDIDRIFLKRDANSTLFNELKILLGNQNIPIKRVPLEKLNRLTKKNHQGVIAFKAVTTYYTLEQIIPHVYEQGRDPLLVILDGITDVRNFGAIARSCECMGVDAIVVFEQNSVSVTADAVKTSAGALARIPVCRELKIESAMEYLHSCGVSIVGATEKGSLLVSEANPEGPLAVVMGAEDTGLSDHSLRHCDQLVKIPMFGNIGSLNVSVATGIVLYDIVSRRKI